MNDQTTATTAGHTYTVDQDICIGCRICCSIAPDGYVMEDNGKSAVVIAGPTDDPLMEDAKDSCPVGAILHTDA